MLFRWMSSLAHSMPSAYVSMNAVTPVERAAEVLDVLRSGGPPVDLILAEVELPNGKGYKMLKHIMKEERLKHLPVVSK